MEVPAAKTLPAGPEFVLWAVNSFSKKKKYIMLKLSLCVTKYHAMKTYPVLNEAPRHEDLWVTGGVAPRILKCLLSFSPRPLYPREKNRYSLDRRLGGPQNRSERGGEKKKIPIIALPGNELLEKTPPLRDVENPPGLSLCYGLEIHCHKQIMFLEVTKFVRKE
jgi:hypothetical protein